ncbi:MAG: SRPBCC domain-containing protein [Deltaproteobacteria bacterium]|nr:MAG: SRPBCC domain-containing protein [Deltaproteobacteria bacterium]
MERAIESEIAVAAPLDAVWDAWTTPEGVVTFFGPKARISLAIGGPYEIYFMPEAPVGFQGSEGCTVLSFLPKRIFSFSWNAPPEFPEVRAERTWVVLRFDPLGEAVTRVRLSHLGWKEGEPWQKARDYFVAAWQLVLHRLARRFTHGPIDWSDPWVP